MSKDKKLRRIVIDKLFNKNQHPMKQSTRSNAPTESTPNQPKNLGKAIQNFFENFETECAIIYEPVKLKNHKPLKRSLEEQLTILHRNDFTLRIKTEESLSSSKTNHFLKISQKKQINQNKIESQSRIQSYNSISSSKVRQKRTLTVCPSIQNFKTKSILFGSISPSESKLFGKQKHVEFQKTLSRKPSQAIRMQKAKIPTEKSVTILEKQDDQYMTNSKNLISRHILKNAPKKVFERPQKLDRLKRIQSLKNLNENAIRKYSFKRDL